MLLTKKLLKWVSKGVVKINRKGSKNTIFVERKRIVPIEKLGKLIKMLLGAKTVEIGGQLCCFDGTKLIRGYIIPALDQKASDWELSMFCSKCKTLISFHDLPTDRPILCKKCKK